MAGSLQAIISKQPPKEPNSQTLDIAQQSHNNLHGRHFQLPQPRPRNSLLVLKPHPPRRRLLVLHADNLPEGRQRGLDLRAGHLQRTLRDGRLQELARVRRVRGEAGAAFKRGPGLVRPHRRAGRTSRRNRRTHRLRWRGYVRTWLGRAAGCHGGSKAA